MNTTTAPDDLENAPVESSDAGKLHEFWQKELKAAEKETEKFITSGRRVIQKYLDQRDQGGANSTDTDGMYKLNLFWSNTQVIKGNIYAKPPKVEVRRLFKDPNDDIARVAAEILDRILNSGLETDDSDFDCAARNGIEDYLLPGLGQMWLRYDVTTGQQQVAGPDGQLQPYEVIIDEDALSEYVYWQDFRWSPSRTWEQVRWVARRAFISRDQAAKRFGEDVAKELPATKDLGRRRGVQDNVSPQNNVWDRIEIWEIWCKTSKKVYWYCPNHTRIVDEKPDPLGLLGFFPCPRPLMSNTTTSNMIPRADYVMAQDQYDQIDELTTRITYLTRACKMVGVYDKNSTPIGRVFQEGLENQMIPVDNWAAFAEKGGLKGQMDFIPIETAAAVIEKLTVQRDVLINKLYEVMGIADIMRGSSNPNETLGAQQIKAQFGSARLSFKQNEISAWAAAAQQIKAQIICKHWQPETIARRSNIMASEDAQFAQQAIQLLKSKEGLRYRISVDPDTMATLDWAAEREERGAAVNGLGTFMQSVSTLIQAKPEATPMVLSILKWFMAGFKQGSEIETSLDAAIQMANQPQQPPPPDPEKMANVAKERAQAESQRASAVKSLADAAKQGFMDPANAALTQMGLPPANPDHVVSVLALENPPPEPPEPPESGEEDRPPMQ